MVPQTAECRRSAEHTDSLGRVAGPLVHSLFSPIFSGDSRVVESEVRLVDEQLFPEELACVRSAVDRRRAQFGTGRVCARRALAMLGLPEAPLTVDRSGAPRWPDGVVGSITHTSQYCAAVVKPSPPWRVVGLDAEEVGPLDAGTRDLITTEAESRWLASLAPQERMPMDYCCSARRKRTTSYSIP